MRQLHFETFLEALLTSTELIQERYFQLPVAYDEEYVYRERAYCYELYHQIRKNLPDGYPYLLSGEVNKAGHPLIAGECGGIIPDFLVHNAGHMGANDNLVIVEVKTISGAIMSREREGFLKDINTINCMTTIPNGYFKGILLVYGSDYDERKREIQEIYMRRCNHENVLLLFHNNPLEKAIVPE